MKMFRALVVALLVSVFSQDITASIDECTNNDHCAHDRMCISGYCENPCEDICGENSICQFTNHIPVCMCYPGFVGNPLEGCEKPDVPECTHNEDCPSDRMCISQHCEDPCLYVCGKNTICQMTDHIPACICDPGFIGNPVKGCLMPECTGSAVNTKENKTGKYHLEREKMNWFEAFYKCESKNGRLAIVTSEEDNKKILELIEQAFPGTPDSETSVWIGGTDLDGEGHWIWKPTGQPIEGYTNWHEGNPNNNGGREHCMGYWKTRTNKKFKWNDNECDSEHFFVCENVI